MRRTVLYLAGWVAVGVTAVTLATVAVSMVGNQVTGDRPPALSVDEVRAELAGGATASESITTRPSSGSPDFTPGETETSPTAKPSTSTPTSSSTVTTAPGSNTSTPSAPPSIRSYTLEGGTATLRFAASGVTVQEATPRPGYSVEVEATHDTGVRVEFRSDDHRSRVTGWWENGPRDEVDEDTAEHTGEGDDS